ncbi:MAG: STAS domain-containing protein [Acidobacteriota bacterium]
MVLRDTVLEEIESGGRKIIINLQDVKTIDSSGLGELVAAYTSARRHEAAMRLANLTKKIDDLMEITRLASVFEVFNDVDEALASFKN